MLREENRGSLVCFYFLIMFFLYCVKTSIVSSTLDESVSTVVGVALNSSLLLLVTGVFIFLSMKEKVFLFSVFLAFLVNYVFLGNDYYYGYVITVSLCLLSRLIKWKQLISLILFGHFLSLFFLTVILFLSSEHYLYDERVGDRFTAGFSNPNTLGQYVLLWMSLVTLFFDARSKRSFVNGLLQILLVVSLFFLAFIILWFSFSRTALLLAFIMTVAFVASRFFDAKTMKSGGFFCFSLFFFVLLILGFQFYSITNRTGNDFLIVIDGLLSGRIWFGTLLFQSLGLPRVFYGVSISEYLPIDFYFVNVIYGLGFLFFLFFLYLYLIELSRREISLYVRLLLFIFVMGTMTETYFAIPFFSMALFVVFAKNDSLRNC